MSHYRRKTIKIEHTVLLLFRSNHFNAAVERKRIIHSSLFCFGEQTYDHDVLKETTSSYDYKYFENLKTLKMSLLNQAAVEALCSATYLENYLDCVENMPDDLQRSVSEMRELDLQCNGALKLNACCVIRSEEIILINFKSLYTNFNMLFSCVN